MRRRCVEVIGLACRPCHSAADYGSRAAQSCGRNMDHEILATEAGYCSGPWEIDTFRFMADYLVFEQP